MLHKVPKGGPFFFQRLGGSVIAQEFASYLEEASLAVHMKTVVAKHKTVDKSGKTVIVVEWAKVVAQRGTRSGATLVTRNFRLANGRPVNQIDKDTFEVVETNEILRKG